MRSFQDKDIIIILLLIALSISVLYNNKEMYEDSPKTAACLYGNCEEVECTPSPGKCWSSVQACIDAAECLP